MKFTPLCVALTIALLSFLVAFFSLAQLLTHEAYAGAPVTTTISPLVVVVVYGGGAYDDAYHGVPFTIGSGDLAAAHHPALATTDIIVEASQCRTGDLPTSGYELKRTFIEYDTSAITRALVSARLVFTNFQPFSHDGVVGAAAHQLNIYTGTWTATADITPTFVASTTFRGWYSPTRLAQVDFTSPAITYPYPVSLSINPAAVALNGTTRLVLRSSSEYQLGPLPSSCPTDPQGLGNKFTAPLLEVSYAAPSLRYYLPIIFKK